MASLPSSTGPMDEGSFSDRVKKTFGSLFASLEPSPSSLSNPLWSLSGAQAEKREWRRDKDTSARDSNPCSSSFDDFLSQARKESRTNLKNYRKELQDELDDDDDNDDGDKGRVDLDDLDVRSSIGLDSTLDNEEEEDTFDKVATGRENAGDRLYMSDIAENNDSHISSHDDLANTIGIKRRDPRANRQAARIRLKEDDAEAAKQADQYNTGGKAPASTGETETSASAEYCDKLKPILKRKEYETTSQPAKRVRFDPVCVSSVGSASETLMSNITSAEARDQDTEPVLDEKVSRVPDYIRNPSKYKCYSLDSTVDMNDKSNSAALLDHLEMVKRSKNEGVGSEQADGPIDLPKSITFIPKKKSDTGKLDGVHNESIEDRNSHMKTTSLVGIVVGEDQETEIGDMEVDVLKSSAGPDMCTTFRKQGRQYRSKSREDSPTEMGHD